MSSPYRWIVNNFFHDLASGMWAATVLVIWLLETRMSGIPAAAGAALADIQHLLFWIVLASLLVIFVTGGIRLRYWRKQGSADEEAYRRRALLVKHVLYLVIYGAGTVWAWLLQR
jgi:hypothetical protein